MGPGPFAFVSDADEVIDELSFDIWCTRNHAVFRQLFPTPRVKLPDTICAVLEPQAATFGHWLLEMVPRLALAKQYAGRCGSDVRYLINHGGRRHELETFAQLGIPLAQIEQWAPKRCYTADQWIIPSYTSRGALNVSAASRDVVRTCFASSRGARPSKRRLYLSRKSDRFRRVVNEPEVIQMLAEHGFKSVEPAALSVREQAALFAAAEAIVSVISSGLVNLVFMAPGTKVIEIFPESLFLPIQWALCDLCGIDYYYFFEQGSQPTNVPLPGNRYADVNVDLGALARTLELAEL
jgi:capsular polysaccharide biosynthesis protein